MPLKSLILSHWVLETREHPSNSIQGLRRLLQELGPHQVFSAPSQRPPKKNHCSLRRPTLDSRGHPPCASEPMAVINGCWTFLDRVATSRSLQNFPDGCCASSKQYMSIPRYHVKTIELWPLVEKLNTSYWSTYCDHVAVGLREYLDTSWKIERNIQYIAPSETAPWAEIYTVIYCNLFKYVYGTYHSSCGEQKSHVLWLCHTSIHNHLIVGGKAQDRMCPCCALCFP